MTIQNLERGATKPVGDIPQSTGWANAFNNTMDVFSVESCFHWHRLLFDRSKYETQEVTDEQTPLEGRCSEGRCSSTWEKVTHIFNIVFYGGKALFQVGKLMVVSSRYNGEQSSKVIVDMSEPYCPIPVLNYDMYLGTVYPFTAVNDAKMIHNILRSNRNNDRCPFRGGRAFEDTRFLLDKCPESGKQLFTARNEEYAKLRSFFRPKLTMGELKKNEQFGKYLKEYSLQVIEKMAAAPEGHIDDLSKVLMELPSNIIQSLLFGKAIDGVKEAMWELIPNIHKDISALPRLWPTTAKIKSTSSYQHLEQIASEIFKSPENYPGILGEMAAVKGEDGKLMFSEDHIFSSMMLFLLAGEDTLMSALTCMLYALAKNPECQEKLYKEIQSSGFEEDISLEKLDALEYLGLIVKETTRMYPSIPAQVREVNPMRENLSEPVVVEGTNNRYIIPEGRQLILHTYEIMHHPDMWEHPYQFIPERHSAEGTQKYNTPKRGWYPFSVGPNRCLGESSAILQMKALLYYATPRLQFRSDQEVNFDLGVSLRSKQEPVSMEVWSRT